MPVLQMGIMHVKGSLVKLLHLHGHKLQPSFLETGDYLAYQPALESPRFQYYQCPFHHCFLFFIIRISLSSTDFSSPPFSLRSK